MNILSQIIHSVSEKGSTPFQIYGLRMRMGVPSQLTPIPRNPRSQLIIRGGGGG